MVIDLDIRKVRSIGIHIIVVLIMLAEAASAQILPVSGSISAGTGHAVAVRADGRVFSWGNNVNGRLGIGNTTSKPAPTLINAITSSARVQAGGAHTVALKTDGSVWAWGLNTSGQLGDNTLTQRTSPVQIAIAGVTSVAAGGTHTLALKSDGSVWAWGANPDGRLGDNSTIQRNAPVAVSNLSGVVMITAGGGHSLALKGDGTVWAWGSNTNGQLGDGTSSQRTEPVLVAGISQVVAISAGNLFSLALKSDGTVWAWGGNASGALGDGSTQDKLSPVQVAGVAGVTQVAAGTTHALALKFDGTLFAWGSNSSCELADGTLENRATPISVPDVAEIVSIAAGANYSLALKSDGTLNSWGDNSLGQLGIGLASPRKSPTQTHALSSITKVSVRGGTGAAIRSGGKLFLWGVNSSGKIGDGSTVSRRLPYANSALGNITDVSVGMSHVLAVKPDGTVWSWGSNTYGQLGDGTTTDRLQPVMVTGLTSVIRVSAGSTHSLALKSDGTVWAWGDNTNGRLGNGSTISQSVPVQTLSISGAVDIGAGESHSVALKNDGTVRAWGANTNGRLGDGTTSQRIVPVQVIGLSQIASISVGLSHNIALAGNGYIWVWGNNANGRLGDGTTTQRATPVQLGMGMITQISAGDSHSAAVINGALCSWGSNGFGQLGDGTTTQRTSYVPLVPPMNSQRIVAGSENTFSVGPLGVLMAWGANIQGSLGVNEPRINQVAALRTTVTSLDIDRDGLLDVWETEKFGNISRDGSQDYDGDGLTDSQEHIVGSNPSIADEDGDALSDIADPAPKDYYNGIPPLLVILDGNNQNAGPSAWNIRPFDIAVWGDSGTYPLKNAPSSFTILSGGGSLFSGGNVYGSNHLAQNTDLDGTAQAHFQQPMLAGVTSTIQFTAGTSALTLNTSSVMSPDSDGDGLTDAQETALGSNSASPDTDSDGIRDELEARLGLNITVPDAADVPKRISALRLLLRANDGIAVDGSGNVNSWNDQSVHGNHTAQSGTARPKRVANVVNGLPVVRFDGVDDMLHIPSLVSEGTAFDLFIVSKANGITEKPIISTGSSIVYLPDAEGLIYDGLTSSRYIIASTAANLQAFGVYNSSSTNGRLEARMNGIQIYGSALSSFKMPQALSVGYGSGTFYKGDIAEIIVFERIVDRFEREALEAYLSNKYGVGHQPPAPTTVKAIPISSTRALVTWDAPSTLTSATVFKVERSDNDGPFVFIASEANSSSYVDVTAIRATTHKYRVSARGLKGANSTYSLSNTVVMPFQAPDFPIADASMWLAADRGINPGALSWWPDLSSNGGHAYQEFKVSRPTVVSNVIAGRAIVRLDGIDDWLAYANLSTDIDSSELFVVWKAAAVNRNQPVLFETSSTYLPAENGLISDEFRGNTGYYASSPTSLMQFFIYNVASSSGEWSNRMNGDFLTSGAGSTFVSTANGYIGTDNLNYAKGDIAEIFIFNRALSPAEKDAVHVYLARKYNLNVTAAYSRSADFNFDGVADLAGRQMGLAVDNWDTDGDGVTNFNEWKANTDPLHSDTDRDGYTDNIDAFPRDPLRHNVVVDTSDITAPVVFLRAPAGATIR